jgi:hypothetical protein
VTSRRGFLGAIAAALVLDPERALWVPGAKKIFLPPAPRETGILIRMIRSWDHDLARFTVHMDCLWGLQAQQNAQLDGLRFDRNAFTLVDSGATAPWVSVSRRDYARRFAPAPIKKG